MEPDSGAGASDGELGNPDQLTVTWREEREAVGEVEVSVEGEEEQASVCGGIREGCSGCEGRRV